MPDAFAETPGMAYLRKAKLSRLLAAEKTATQFAMAVSGRPDVTIHFDAITPHNVGEFIYLYEFATSTRWPNCWTSTRTTSRRSSWQEGHLRPYGQGRL